MKVLVFSEIKWDYLRTRKQQIISRFPPEWKILFIEPFKAGGKNKFAPVNDENVIRLTIPFFKNFKQRWIKALLNVGIIRQIIFWINALWIKQALRLTEFEKPDVIIISNIYYSRTVRKFLKNVPVIYDCNDDHSSFPNAPQWLNENLIETINISDLIVYCHPALLANIETNGTTTAHIGNGVNSDMFARQAKKPAFIFVGAISEWVDLDLVGKMANVYADEIIWMVGPIASPASNSFDNLRRRYKNIRYLGVVSQDDAATLMAVSSVGIIPFKVQSLTNAAIAPNKLFEYLAAGLPVVTTIGKNGATYKDVLVAEDHDDFIFLAGEALQIAEKNKEGRKAWSDNHDWEKKSKQFVELINAIITH